MILINKKDDNEEILIKLKKIKCLFQVLSQIQDPACVWIECNGCVPKTAWGPAEDLGWGRAGEVWWVHHRKGKLFGWNLFMLGYLR